MGAPRKRFPVVGTKYGRLTLTVLKPGVPYMVTCRCDCGVEKDYRWDSMYTGNSTSCGCKAKENQRARCTTHGCTVGGKIPREYHIWASMHERCRDPRCPEYRRYGGRGIKVCEQWTGRDGYVTFMADMGPRPSREHSVDRKDNDGDYTPDNCHWATRLEQAANKCNNRNLTINGVTLHMAEWARRTGIANASLQYRLDHGMDPLAAVTTPIKRHA